ncbi:hypothetical protein DPQ22_06150 [Candidatus Tokpelaia sp.]|nr:hypothetical protein DPQ22_06150 [Candidatus Tokpelaia sp.]
MARFCQILSVFLTKNSARYSILIGPAVYYGPSKADCDMNLPLICFLCRFPVAEILAPEDFQV